MITLGHYLKPYSKRIALGTVIKIVGTITELFLPWILSYMIDEVAPEKNVARIFLWGAVMLACAVVALLGNITANRMASKVARDTTESMRFDLFDKTLNLSARQTDGFAMPSLVSRLSSDTYNVHNMIGMIQRLGTRAYAADWRDCRDFHGRTRAGAGFAGDNAFSCAACRARG